MIHYHGTPITPAAVLYTLKGANFCVSFADPRQCARVHEQAQSVMLDNGAFSAFTKGRAIEDWRPFYDWADRWLDYPTTWAVIPDVIDAGQQQQDALLREWPFPGKGAPVWHMDEPTDRLLRLLDEWPRVCFGSTQQFWQVLSDPWRRRADHAWNEIAKRHARTPNCHMLRGMQLSGLEWPFANVDSTDVARNHNRAGRSAAEMVKRWDAVQCPARWVPRQWQGDLYDDRPDFRV